MELALDLEILCGVVDAALKTFADKYNDSAINTLIGCEKVIGCGNNVKRPTKKLLYTNHDAIWTNEHNEHLMRMYKDGRTKEAMSDALKRSPKAIEFQIAKLLIVDQAVANSTPVALAKKYKKNVKVISKSIDVSH